MKHIECRDCGEEFLPFPGKPGFVDQCEKCGVKKEVPRLGGFMEWSHKTAPSIVITSMPKARELWAKTARLGAGVTKCIATGQNRAYSELTGDKPE